MLVAISASSPLETSVYRKTRGASTPRVDAPRKLSADRGPAPGADRPGPAAAVSRASGRRTETASVGVVALDALAALRVAQRAGREQLVEALQDRIDVAGQDQLRPALSGTLRVAAL